MCQGNCCPHRKKKKQPQRRRPKHSKKPKWWFSKMMKCVKFTLLLFKKQHSLNNNSIGPLWLPLFLARLILLTGLSLVSASLAPNPTSIAQNYSLGVGEVWWMLSLHITINPGPDSWLSWSAAPMARHWWHSGTMNTTTTTNIIHNWATISNNKHKKKLIYKGRKKKYS